MGAVTQWDDQSTVHVIRPLDWAFDLDGSAPISQCHRSASSVMAPVTRRHRSSTAASTSSTHAALTAELESPLQSLHDLSAANADAAARLPSTVLSQYTQLLHRIRRSLVDSSPPGQAKDVFRHLYGFQALLDVLRSLSGFYMATELSHDARAAFFDLLHAVTGVLSDALRDHRGNRRYFSRRVEGGGWTALEQALASSGVGGAAAAEDVDGEGEEQLFGCLFAFALADDSHTAIFGTIRRRLEDRSSATDLDVVQAVRQTCRDLLPAEEVLRNPEIVPTMFRFWMSLHGHPAGAKSTADLTSLALLVALQQITTASEHNHVAMHSTGILSVILPHVFDRSLPAVQTTLLRELAETVIQLGIANLEDAKFLYAGAVRSADVARFLLTALRSSKGPSRIHFDLSLHGFASVELASLGRTFPPMSQSAGYTIATWIYIDRFDPTTHTTIFGAFDATQTCFLLAYLEKDTRNFILQTSVTSSKPSVRFKSLVFGERQWYHVVLVHHRPRTMRASRASLFVNGAFRAPVKWPYPASPPPLAAQPEGFATRSTSSPKQTPVQVFLGTPQDLSSRVGQHVVSCRWSLASFHLFGEVLSDDLVVVYYRLGPRYAGNFQDCLGSFQTYEASAMLNMRNESMHPGKEDKSDIVAAVRLKASSILPEARVLLHISPLAVFDGMEDESPLLGAVSKQAANNLHQATRSGASAVAVNCAIPSINEALCRPNGTAVLTGEPVVVLQSSLDDASWCVAGCAAIGLKMVEMARTRDDLVRAVEVLLESVKDNWRNSEAMERQNAFSILAALIRAKMGVGFALGSVEAMASRAIEGGIEEQRKLSFELLNVILGFVGYRHARAEDSIVINPLAYRLLLVDFDTWRRTAPTTQKLYYEQFVMFGVQSRYHQYNAKRLLRMRMPCLQRRYL